MKYPIKKVFIIQEFGENLFFVPRNHSLLKFRRPTSANPPISLSTLSKRFWVTLFCMLARATKQFKIFNSVIKRVVVFMVNHLARFQYSSNVFSHNQSMNRNISLFSTVGVVPVLNVIVATPQNVSLILRVLCGVVIQFFERLANFLSIFSEPLFAQPDIIGAVSFNKSHKFNYTALGIL